MAIIAESFVVVARREAVEALYQGGESAFMEVAPNATACRDGSLCSVSFMVERDASSFMADLASGGLQGPGRDFTLFDTRTGQHQGGRWLASATVQLPAHDGSGNVPVQILYLDGTDPGHVCAYDGHKIGMTKWVSNDDLSVFEFVDEQRGVTTLRHRETGELRYIGRSGTDQAGLDIRFRVLSARIWAAADPPVGPVSDALQRELLECISRVRSLQGAMQGDARCTLLLGVCHRRLGEWEAAEQAFRRLTVQRPTFLGGWLDLVWALAEQGRHSEALPVARHALALDPSNPAALGNVAATLLVLGELRACREIVSQALSIDPEDRVNRAILKQLQAKEDAGSEDP